MIHIEVSSFRFNYKKHPFIFSNETGHRVQINNKALLKYEQSTTMTHDPLLTSYSLQGASILSNKTKANQHKREPLLQVGFQDYCIL